jgi:hypothetical protein
MASDKNWYGTLTLIDVKTRGIALVALVVDAGTLGTIPLLPSVDRIYGYVGFACVLIVTLICMVVVAKSTSQDHTQPNLGVMVRS